MADRVAVRPLRQRFCAGEYSAIHNQPFFYILSTTAYMAAETTTDALERQEFLRGLNGDYQRLRSSPELWEQYVAERHDWDALA